MLTELYSAEAKRLLEKYATMRQEVLRQDKALRSIGQFSVYQERLITEVRQFTTLNLMPVLSVLQKLNIEAEEHAKLEHKRIKNMLTGINDFACQFDGNVDDTSGSGSEGETEEVSQGPGQELNLNKLLEDEPAKLNRFLQLATIHTSNAAPERDPTIMAMDKLRHAELELDVKDSHIKALEQSLDIFA